MSKLKKQTLLYTLKVNFNFGGVGNFEIFLVTIVHTQYQIQMPWGGNLYNFFIAIVHIQGQ